VKKQAAILFTILLLAATVCSQGMTETILEVENMPPIVTNPGINPIIRANPTANVPIECNASVRDLNGISDVVNMSAVFFNTQYSSAGATDNPQTHYTSTDYSLNPQTITTGVGRVFFNIQPQAASGTWDCVIMAMDAGGGNSSLSASGSNTTKTTLFPVSCSNNRLDDTEELIDCGGVCPTCFAITGINASAVSGTTIIAMIRLNYQSSQTNELKSFTPGDLRITSMSEEELIEGEGVIAASNIKLTTNELSMLGIGDYYFEVEIHVPASTILGDYRADALFEVESGQVFTIPIHLRVQMPNVPPEVREISVTYPLILDPKKAVEFSCNASIFDANGIDDVDEVVFEVEHKSEQTLDVAFLDYQLIETSLKAGNASGRFMIGSSAKPGLWSCKVTAGDVFDAQGENTTDFRVYPSSCTNKLKDTNEKLSDCGGVCPPCLEAQDAFARLKGGSESSSETFLYSRAPTNITIEEIRVGDLVGPAVIEKRRVKVGKTKFTLPPKVKTQVPLRIITPQGLDKGKYIAKAEVLTNTTLNTEFTITADLLYRGEGFMKLDASEGCVGKRMNQTLIDEWRLKPIIGAKISVFLADELINQLETDFDGKTLFMPRREGRYNFTAEHAGYKTESILRDVTLCGIGPQCDDGLKNQDEEKVDCGGEKCPPCQCTNGVLDQNEVGLDCGGVCPACHCSDGVYNHDEQGIDCGGGECPPCPKFNLVPLLEVKTKRAVKTGKKTQIQVDDNNLRATQALLTIENPNKEITKVRTNRSGGYMLDVTHQGIWTIDATRPGYFPASTTLVGLESTIYNAAAVGSILFALLFVMAVRRYMKKQRKFVVTDAATLRKLFEEGVLPEIKRVYLTKKLVDTLEVELKKQKQVKPIQLSSNEVSHANTLSEDYGVGNETAELLVLCDKIKARKFITDQEIPDELRSKMKEVRILSYDEAVK